MDACYSVVNIKKKPCCVELPKKYHQDEWMVAFRINDKLKYEEGLPTFYSDSFAINDHQDLIKKGDKENQTPGDLNCYMKVVI